MSGDISLMVIALCCLLSLALFLRDEIKPGKSDVDESGNPEKQKSQKSTFSDPIVGKTKTKIGQTGTTNDKLTPNYQRIIKEHRFAQDGEGNNRLVIPNEEMDKVFYTREEAGLNVDVQYEYEEPDWEAGDDEILFDETESTIDALAQGVSFDEMNKVSQALQNDVMDLGNDNAGQVAHTINKVEVTDMFEQLVSGVNDGKQKVADILDRCEALINPVAADKNNKVNEFDINNYM